MPTSSELRRASGGDQPTEPDARPVERYLPTIIAVAAVVASLALTIPYLGKTWLLGDLAYHRGVVLSIDAAHLFGQGPIAGVMSYYGGTYHLLLAGISAITGLSFEGAVAVLSLVWAVVWPLGLLALGRRLWHSDWLPTSVFALIATLAMPLTIAFGTRLWVESVLPSSIALWPVYPRDLAMTFGLLTVVSFLSPRRLLRTVAAGVLLAVSATSLAQIAATFAALLLAWAIWRAIRGDGPGLLVDAAAALVLAVILSAWWWLPRIEPLLAGPALLADSPIRDPFRMGPIDFVVHFSWVGLIAVAAIAVAAVQRRAPGGHAILAIWIVILLPLLVFDRVAAGSAFAPERRTWLQLSVPIAAIAAYELVGWLRRAARPALAVAVSALLVASSLPAAVVTVDGLRLVWEDHRMGGRPWPAEEWDPTVSQLKAMRADGPVEILTYDTEAPWVWSLTGVNVFSLWLPGPIKLGFDPAPLTGTGFLERVGLATRAFDAGTPGICDLARAKGIDNVLLQSLNDLVATHDHAFAAPYRTDPAERDELPDTRPVAPGVSYVDSGQDWLLVDAGTRVPIPFTGDHLERVAVEVRNEDPQHPVRITLRGDDWESSERTDPDNSIQPLRFEPPARAEASGMTIESDGPVLLLRALGYEAVDLGQPKTGTFLASTDAVCRAASDG
jgi:hypothetical protein